MWNIKMFFLLLMVIFSAGFQGTAQKSSFDKSAFYVALASDNLDEINTQLNLVKAFSFGEKEAYEGALLMKKAGIVNKAKEKLALFKTGRLKLETSIKKEPGNTEFYFLRLIIQEHAPKMVRYDDDIVADSMRIRTDFKNLSSVVRQAIHDYSKKSNVLKTLQP